MIQALRSAVRNGDTPRVHACVREIHRACPVSQVFSQALEEYASTKFQARVSVAGLMRATSTLTLRLGSAQTRVKCALVMGTGGV